MLRQHVNIGTAWIYAQALIVIIRPEAIRVKDLLLSKVVQTVASNFFQGTFARISRHMWASRRGLGPLLTSHRSALAGNCANPCFLGCLTAGVCALCLCGARSYGAFGGLLPRLAHC
jgi:hypothetical protein